jgi:hypothetical protein
MSGRVDMNYALALWLQHHPGQTEADFDRVGRPFSAGNAQHKRDHHEFLEWLNTVVFPRRTPPKGQPPKRLRVIEGGK